MLQDGANTYIYGMDLISATDGGATQTYLVYDGLGSTRHLTNGAGTVTATYEYFVFGLTRKKTGTGDTPWRFTGEQRDSESGFYYLRARCYDPAAGRFLTRDRIAFLQRYAFNAYGALLSVSYSVRRG